MSDSFTVRLCFNPFLPLESKNSQHPEISASANLSVIFCYICNCVFMSSVAYFFIYCRAISDIKSPDIKLTSKRWECCHSGEPGIVLFGFPEWSSKWFMVTCRQMFLMFASSWWFIGSLTLLLSLSLSLSAGGWVALRWVHQGSLLQPWKIWGELKWCLSIWNVTLLYCFIRHYAEKNKFQYCYCKKNNLSSVKGVLHGCYFAANWTYGHNKVN